MSNEFVEVNGIKVDVGKANTALAYIIMKEINNLKTEDKSDSQMVKLIKDKIEEVSKCY